LYLITGTLAGRARRGRRQRSMWRRNSRTLSFRQTRGSRSSCRARQCHASTSTRTDWAWGCGDRHRHKGRKKIFLIKSKHFDGLEWWWYNV